MREYPYVRMLDLFSDDFAEDSVLAECLSLREGDFLRDREIISDVRLNGAVR